MKEFGCRPFANKIGILVAQLGTPDAPTASALRRYLKEFLADPRVIETNRLLWWIILHGIVLVTRPSRSAKLYKRVWTAQGSPLLLTTEAQTRELQRELGSEVQVEFGMRYGKPLLTTALDRLCEAGCTKILLVPMYPQYSAPTSASTYDMVFSHILRRRFVPTLQVLDAYFSDKLYLQSLGTVINEALAKLPKAPERLILSYHGIPQAYARSGDPYCCQCVETTRAVRPFIKLPPEQIMHCFQSRFGRDPWLEPYTDQTIERLAREGVKRIAVAAPGFTTDCLETIDELGHEGRKLFQKHGGEELHLIPCLNQHPAWIKALGSLVNRALTPWRGESCIDPVECKCPWGESHKQAVRR